MTDRRAHSVIPSGAESLPKGISSLACNLLVKDEISPLRYATVEMTERGGMTNQYPNLLRTPNTYRFDHSPVIPSGAEGSHPLRVTFS
jgi:hypothetical protein